MTASRDERPLAVRLKSKKKRTVSQKRWLERQLNDPYVARARREGMRSRAAYKLIEIDDKYHLLKAGGRVVDLGAAPGGWSEMAAKRVGVGVGRGKVVAIDLLEMAPIAGVDFLQLDFLDPTAPEKLIALLEMAPIAGVDFLQLDFLDPTAPEKLIALLDGGADVVLSDMAANATGHKKTDQLKIMALVEAGIEFAREVLRPGGSFLTKVLQGGTDPPLLAALKRDFATVKHVKPQASRADSAELYLLAMGFRGGK